VTSRYKKILTYAINVYCSYIISAIVVCIKEDGLLSGSQIAGELRAKGFNGLVVIRSATWSEDFDDLVDKVDLIIDKSVPNAEAVEMIMAGFSNKICPNAQHNRANKYS
jgi:hypothetical protein